MFPDDALWFIGHVQESYVAVCTPSQARDEFIITDNCYNTYNGANSAVRDSATGRVSVGNWSSFHEFAVTSRRLIIVVRSYILPDPHEYHDPEAHRFWLAVGQRCGGNFKPLLGSLPVTNANHSYVEMSNDSEAATDQMTDFSSNIAQLYLDIFRL